MASRFDEIDKRGQGAISAVTGEAIAFLGMISGEYARGVDPGRPQQLSWGTPALVPSVGRVSEGVGSSGASGAARVYNNSELWIDADAFAALSWRLEVDDIVILRPGESGERRFRIMMIAPLEGGDAMLTMSEDRTA